MRMLLPRSIGVARRDAGCQLFELLNGIQVSEELMANVQEVSAALHPQLLDLETSRGISFGSAACQRFGIPLLHQALDRATNYGLTISCLT
jgi:hypothetical protein